MNEKVKKILFILLIILIILGFASIVWWVKVGEQKSYIKSFAVYEQNDTDEIKILKTELEQDLHNKDVLFFIAEAYENEGDLERAIEYYIRCTEVRNDNLYYMNLASLYVRTQNFDKAEQANKKIIENNVKQISAYRNLLTIYIDVKREKLPEFIPIAEYGRQFMPNDSELPKMMALAYREMGNISKAIEFYEIALQFEPNNEGIKEEIEILKNKK